MEEGKGIGHQTVVADLMTAAIGHLKQAHNNLHTSTPIKEDMEFLETQLRTIMDDAVLCKMQQDQLLLVL